MSTEKSVWVIAQFTAKPGKEDQLRELLHGLLAPTHAEEGCRIYDLYETSEQPGKFFFFEEWDSAELLARHAVSPHLKHLGDTVGEFAQGPAQVDVLRPVRK